MSYLICTCPNCGDPMKVEEKEEPDNENLDGSLADFDSKHQPQSVYITVYFVEGGRPVKLKIDPTEFLDIFQTCIHCKPFKATSGKWKIEIITKYYGKLLVHAVKFTEGLIFDVTLKNEGINNGWDFREG